MIKQFMMTIEYTLVVTLKENEKNHVELE